ncbi:zinc transport system substrate-binding protein [Chitinivorax tropicus]|uniref:High-affinity zinc uptake system protein ZnuA n=1 Tax=Chitinivorax tropicus TaxID=714531 RepID=A0A840MJ45_9PROT|nr:zinc ABC transporter substrate-binding protein [Chitinivorax tropicus]MBB5018668.1 zinc transport system substrate-binding protein [Chitinivorax tropicus]
MNLSVRLALLLGLLSMLTVNPVIAKISVFASIPPQKQLIERIGGEKVLVESLVGANRDAHTFEPTPSQLAKLSQATLYFHIGMPFEHSLLKRIAATNPKLRMLDHKQGVSLRKQDPVLELETHPGHAHSSNGADPHIWTSPVLMKKMAATVRDALTQLDAESGPYYQRNYQKLAEDLDQLDHEIRQTLQQAKVARFMVFHPSWGYFAEQYGLTQIAIEYEGKEPGAKTVARIVNLAKQQQIRAIFVQPQFSRRAAESIAQSIGARILIMDDLSEDMIGNLRHIAHTLATQS